MTEQRIYKGVIWIRSIRKWRAHIAVDGELITLGNFVTQKEAAEAYDKAAIRYFDTDAKLNFPGENNE